MDMWAGNMANVPILESMRHQDHAINTLSDPPLRPHCLKKHLNLFRIFTNVRLSADVVKLGGDFHAMTLSPEIYIHASDFSRTLVHCPYRF